MKKIFRIAPFLIALALGMELVPRVQAVESVEQSFQEPTKPSAKSTFHGIVILPNPAEQLLYSQSTLPSQTYFAEKAVVYPEKIQSDEDKSLTEFEDQEMIVNPTSFYTSVNENSKCGNSRKLIKH